MDATRELVDAARRAGFAPTVERPGQVDLRGVTPTGALLGAMRFHLVAQAGEEVWRYEYPARVDILAPGLGLYANFVRHPTPEDFARLGYWWRHLPTGPAWEYRAPAWMRPGIAA